MLTLLGCSGKQWGYSAILSGGGYNSKFSYPISFKKFAIPLFATKGESLVDTDSQTQSMIVTDSPLTDISIINWYNGTKGHYIIVIGV